MVMGTVQRAVGNWCNSQNRDGDDDDEEEEPRTQLPRSMQHTVKPKGVCLHGRPNFRGRRTASKEHRKDGDPSHPTTCQRFKQEESKEASSQVSGFLQAKVQYNWPLPEESDTVPERR